MKQFMLRTYTTRNETDAILKRLNALEGFPEKVSFTPVFFLENNQGDCDITYTTQTGEYYLLGNIIFGNIGLIARVTNVKNTTDTSYVDISLPVVTGKRFKNCIISPLCVDGLGCSYPKREAARLNGDDPNAVILREPNIILSLRRSASQDFVTAYSMGWACTPSSIDMNWLAIFNFVGLMTPEAT